MKDIYSPLEIDEEWDQRAPDMGSNEGGGTTVAVAPESGVANSADMSSEVGTSTLPPEQAADMSNDINTAPMAGDTVEPAGDMAHDPAHDAAEAVVAQPVTANEASDVTPAPADTLDINDMNSIPEPSAEGVDKGTVDKSTEVGGNDVSQSDNTEGDTAETTVEPEPMKVNVMGDTEADVPDNKVEAGETFNPETFPGGKMPEPETVEPEAKENETPEPELPASPVVDTEAEDQQVNVEDVIAPEDMDSTDKRLMAAIDRWKQKKAQEVKDLTELREKVESDIAKMNDEIADLQGRVSTKESELDSIGQLLDEIGEVEQEPEAA